MIKQFRAYHTVFEANRGDVRLTLAALNQVDAQRASNSVVETLFPFNGEWFGQYATDQSRRNVMRSLAACLIAMRASGHVPPAIPSASLDPISGKPLHFAPIPGGFKVWGVDKDGVDHGGAPYDPKKNVNPLETDVVYQYPWTPPALPTQSTTAKTPSR
jgi:hypothetical protein